jgi:hypothetical protein
VKEHLAEKSCVAFVSSVSIALTLESEVSCVNVNLARTCACVCRLVIRKESEKYVRVEKVMQTTTVASRLPRGESKEWPWCHVHGRSPHDFS